MELLAGVGAAIVTLATSYLALTLVLSFVRERRSGAETAALHYVFVVPARDEARVIANTIDSLLALPEHRTSILIVDDGSTDDTASIVATYASSQVALLSRVPPDAGVGKGAVLNAAYDEILRSLGGESDPCSIVVGIVDADGRLPSTTLDVADRFFADPAVGALQLQVRIRNRHTLLGRCQDYEFLLFSTITQGARQHLGSVGLGGNGQFVRLAALASIGPSPWSDCLTEDLDLGIRLALAGWRNCFTADAHVDQQGVDTLARLVRQRTRWMQGHFQCLRFVPRIFRSELPTVTALDLCYYLLAPCLALGGPLVFSLPLAMVAIAVATNAAYYLGEPEGRLYLGVLYLASFAPMLGMCLLYRRRTRDLSRRAAFVFAHVLALYSWVWYVAEWRAVVRTITGRRAWTKTTRIPEVADVIV